MDQRFYDMLESNPVIAAVKDIEGLEKCCQLEDIKVIFILFGDILRPSFTFGGGGGGRHARH